VRRLIGKGLPPAAAIGYLLGGPIVNPIVAVSTGLAYAFDWRIAAWRLALGYLIAVAVGLAMGRIFGGRSALIDADEEDGESGHCCGHTHTHFSPAHGKGAGSPILATVPEPACACGCDHGATGWADRFAAAWHHAVDDFLAVGHFLIIGAFVAALAQTFIDRAVFLAIARTPSLAAGMMMTLAASLNLCSEADAFIASSFRGLTPLSAQLAFMLTGPMFDLKLLLMYQSLFRRKAIVVLAALVLAGVLAVSLAFEWTFGKAG